MEFIGNIFNFIIVYPLSYVMTFFYNLFQNYVLALIFFTLIVKILMIPLGFKQQKSLMKQAVMAPKLKEIKEKYKDDPRKMQEEQQKLTIESGSSMLSGCLPMLIQLPIIFGLLEIVRNPLTWINGIHAKNIPLFAQAMGIIGDPAKATQIQIIQKINEVGLTEKATELFSKYNLTQGDIVLNFNFLGLNLAGTPSLNHLSWLWLIPIFAGATAFLQAYISQQYTLKESQTSTTKMMMFMSPVLSLVFTFMWPAAIGFYWGVSSLFSAVQTHFLGKKYDPNKYVIELEQKAVSEKQQKKIQEKLAKRERMAERMKEYEEMKKKYRK